MENIIIDKGLAKRLIRAIERLESIVEFSHFARGMVQMDTVSIEQLQRDKQNLIEQL